jgi:hypothetical protein
VKTNAPKFGLATAAAVVVAPFLEHRAPERESVSYADMQTLMLCEQLTSR